MVLTFLKGLGRYPDAKNVLNRTCTCPFIISNPSWRSRENNPACPVDLSYEYELIVHSIISKLTALDIISQLSSLRSPQLWWVQICG